MINDLLSTVKGGARKNKYRVLLPVDGEIGKTMDILCTTTSLPGRTITPAEVIIKGHKCHLSGETSLEGTWEATFYNTENHEYRNYFMDWMKSIHSNEMEVSNNSNIVSDIIGDARNAFDVVMGAVKDPIGTFFGLESSNYPKYQRNILVYQLDSNGNVTSGIELIGAFPTNVSAIDLDDSASEISTTTVTFNYNDIRVGIKGSKFKEDLMEVGSKFLNDLL